MPTISPGSTSSVSVSDSEVISFSCDPGEVAVFEVYANNGSVVSGVARNSQTVGPFASGGKVSITAQRGEIAFTVSAVVSSLLTNVKELVAGVRLDYAEPVSRAMLELGRGDVLPAPARIVPAKATGNTRYLDPAWGGPYNGTFAQPYNAPTQATLAAGDQLLFKAGTTTTVSSHIFPAVTGTSSAPIIYGVYDPTTGERLVNVVGAATIISTESTGSVFIFGANKDYICVDGLRLKAAAVNTFGVVDSNGGLNSQVTNCEIYEGGFAGVRVYGNGHVIQGNTIRDCGGAGVYVYQTGNIPSDAAIQYNTIKGNTLSGVYAFDEDGAAGFSGTVAGNVFSDNGGTTPGLCGVSLLNGGGAAKIYRNVIKRSPCGVALDGRGDVARDFSGALVENNDISDCAEFGISTSAAKGSWVIQHNRVLRSGSFDGGATQGASRGYGRSIELYGAAAATATSDGVVRFNYVSRAFCWLLDGSEGVGIGLDDNTRNVDVYGNYVELCEGNGVQVNRGFGCRVFGNILVDNVIAPESRGTVFFNALGAQVFYIGTPWLKVFNNTIVFTGRTLRGNQKYGIAEIDSVLSRSASVTNNVIVGATYAGIVKTTTAGGSTEDANVLIDCPRRVVNTSLAEIATGANTRNGSAADINLSDPFYSPIAGGLLDGTGLVVDGGAMSFSGQSFGSSVPVGALQTAL